MEREVVNHDRYPPSAAPVAPRPVQLPSKRRRRCPCRSATQWRACRGGLFAMTARDRQATWVTIMRDKVQRQPELAVCTFLADGEVEQASITYAQLDARARAIAAELQVGTARGRGAGQATGRRALLMYPPGLEYIAGFLGCLYAGFAAVPIYFPHLPRLGATGPRLRGVVADAQPDVVLTTAAGMKFAPALASELSELRSVAWVATDELNLER